MLMVNDKMKDSLRNSTSKYFMGYGLNQLPPTSLLFPKFINIAPDLPSFLFLICVRAPNLQNPPCALPLFTSPDDVNLHPPPIPLLFSTVLPVSNNAILLSS